MQGFFGKRVIGVFLFNLYVAAFVAVIFLILEGVASTIVSYRLTDPTRAVAERLYCEYDPDLGWISKAGIRAREVYGPGRDVITNAQRFRNSSDTAPRVPAGKVRVICSGDSFTFGYGVNNDDAWCQQLSVLDRRIESVNMGQGGYGFDQAYLWYKRDGVPLEHDAQIMAFIAVDFDRMRGTQSNGVGKPVLALEGGRLVTKNTPVPGRHPAILPTWASRYWDVVENLKLFGLLREAGQGRNPVVVEGLARERIPSVVDAAIADLARLHRERGSILELAYLPTEEDYGGKSKKYQLWREPLTMAAAEHGAIFLDLVAEISKLPPQRVPELFLHAGDLPFRGADGHYTDQGNRFIAEKVHELLAREPRFQALFGRR